MSGRNYSNKGVAWLYSEVCALLDVWADHEIQQQLAGRLHNMCVYDKISRRLMDLGIERTGEQCREKIKKLKRDYKIVVDNNYSSAFARKLLGCYDKVNEIFGKCSVVKPSSVVESLLWNEEDSAEANNGVRNDSIQLESTNDCEKSNDSINDSLHKPQNEGSRDSFQENECNPKRFPSRPEYFNDNEKREREVSHRDFGAETSCKRRKKSHEQDEDMERIFDSMIKRQDELHRCFIEHEKNRFNEELLKERNRLLSAENERVQNREHETKLFKNLLNLLASKQGITIDFDASAALTSSHSK